MLFIKSFASFTENAGEIAAMNLEFTTLDSSERNDAGT
jgi:hypothetical protein